MKKINQKGIASVAAIIIGLMISAVVVVGIVVVTQKKAPVSEEPISVPVEKIAEEEKEEEQIPQFANECGLTITSPLPNQTVSFPLTISGIVGNTGDLECAWRRHEGEAGNVKVFDVNGNQVSDIVFIMPIEWMVAAPSSFSIVIPNLTAVPATSDLTLIFTETNDPAGFQGNDTLTIPISLSTQLQSQIQSPPPNGSNGNTMTVQVFFLNSIFNPGFIDCNVVHPIVRTIPQTLAVGMASLEELIKGPTTTEDTQGYSTSISDDVTIQSFSISNGVAYVDLSQELQDTNTGLCAGQFIHAQIKETLLQFSTVNSVVISINGDTNFVQP